MSRLYLLATDGSDVSGEAIEYAREFLNSEQTKILVLSVADESKLVPYLMEDEATMGGLNMNQFRKELEEQADDAIKKAVNTLETDGFEVDSRTEFGDPGTEICEIARDENVDGIIMGRRGRSTVGELLLGSVSHYVVHHVECPVTLVPSLEEGQET